ncbi:MAG: sigma-70 family RNA polymerase sigma factor [Actinomycetota bacterium]|nr:sigma-70 family RNA polymerase sigma factor [Actinomycetota bacterium]
MSGEGDARGAIDDPAARLTTAFTRGGRGDEGAFAEIYDALSGLVYGVILNVVRDPSMSEEVAQEVFVELWRLAPRFDAERGSPRTWAATIAHRRAVDRVSSEDARRRRDERELVVFDEPTDVVIEAVTTELDRQRLWAALATLTETQREAMTLAYYGGHTYRAVAVLLDVPEGTIKTRVRDGLIRLRDQLGVMS